MKKTAFIFILVPLFLFLVTKVNAATQIDKDTIFTSDTIGEVEIVADNITLDCNGYGINQSSESRIPAVTLKNRTNVTIKNCLFRYSFNGIDLGNSSFNKIINNTFNYNKNISISLYQSNFNEISDNYFYSGNEGIDPTDGSTNNLIQNNRFFSNTNAIINYLSDSNKFIANVFDSNITDLFITRSKNLSLKNNKFINSKMNSLLIIDGSTVSVDYFIHDIDNSNTINNKPVYYFVNEINKVIPPDASFVVIVNSHNITIKNLELVDNNRDGILLVNSTDSLIQNVRVVNAKIRLINSNKNIIEDSEIRNGITLENSSSNQLKNNSILCDNIGYNYGIRVQETSTKNLIASNTINFCYTGLYLINIETDDNTIVNNTITLNGSGITYLNSLGNNLIYHNNIYNNNRFNIEGLYTTSPGEISYLREGNYWGHTSAPCFYQAGGLNTPYDSNKPQIIDSYSYCQKDGWIKPNEFFSEVKNSTNRWFIIRKTPGTQNKPANDIIKIVPNKWVVKVLNTTDENGNNIGLDDYSWYKVEDVTDGTIGWIAAKSLSDGVVYLDYNAVTQADLQAKAENQLDTSNKRELIVLESVNNYYTKDNLDNSLYGGGGGFDGLNNFQRFIQGSNFPKELILAIAAQESGTGHNNEVCSSAKDGGIGVMQITSPSFKGLGSGLENYPKKDDCNARTGWIGDFSKYYSNVFQGIYANIKDGFRVLQQKYRQKCPKENIYLGGYEFTCQDIEKILTTWGYNGFAKDKETGLYIGNYLKLIANKLKNLNNYFSNIVYPNNDNLIEKLEVANNNKQVIRLYSPATLHIFDSAGRTTGLINDSLFEEIPSSLYERESEAAVIFFPFDNYRYRVVGTTNGNYSFSVDYTRNGVLKRLDAFDIPITLGEIHEYIIDWEALDRGERGATIKVDKEGDGVFDYQFQSSALLQDKIAPVTDINISGQAGANDWYLSDVQVSLTAQDNEGGVGVLKTEYSLDNGISWNIYQNPFFVSKEGAGFILYRSQDFLGNLEDTKNVEIKIDKTPPEARIYFDKDTQNLKIEGIDNLTLSPKVASTTAGFVFPNEEIKDIGSYIKAEYSEYGYGMPLFYQTQTDRQKVVYKIQDDVGHTLTLNFKKFFDKYYFIYVQLESLQYDNSPAINLSKNKLYYFWFLDRSKEINFLYQKAEVLGQFAIKAFYNHYKNETKIEIENGGVKKNQTQLGLVIIKIITKSGNLGFEF